MKVTSENKMRKQFGAKRLRAMWEDGDPDLKSADFRESIQNVLQEVDEQLSVHGLELVMEDTGSDNYVWYIEKMELPNAMYQPEYNKEVWDDAFFNARMVYRDKKQCQADFPELKVTVLHPSQIEHPIFVDHYED
jgi:hypothetical protein